MGNTNNSELYIVVNPREFPEEWIDWWSEKVKEGFYAKRNGIRVIGNKQVLEKLMDIDFNDPKNAIIINFNKS